MATIPWVINYNDCDISYVIYDKLLRKCRSLTGNAAKSYDNVNCSMNEKEYESIYVLVEELFFCRKLIQETKDTKLLEVYGERFAEINKRLNELSFLFVAEYSE